jgi:PleD family two-component response regulator
VPDQSYGFSAPSEPLAPICGENLWHFPAKVFQNSAFNPSLTPALTHFFAPASDQSNMDDSLSASGSSAAALGSDSSGIVLIVDDNPSNLRLLSAVLTKEGYDVRKALSGSMALQVALNAPPDLMLLDIMMPDMDGYSVCKLFKEQPNLAEIPVIFLSALDEAFDKVRAFRAGGADYITKPFQLEEVLARVQHQLALRFTDLRLRDLNLQLEARVQERTRQLA